MSNNFVSEQKLPGSCQICGKPISDLLIQFAGKSADEFVCESCNCHVCGKCFSRSRKKCVRCTTGGNSWCKVPGLPL